MWKRVSQALGFALGALMLGGCGSIYMGGEPANGGTITQLPETGMRLELIYFPAGSDRAAMQDNLRGPQVVDYLLNTQTGRYLQVYLATDNSSCFFDILEPGEVQRSIFRGPASGRQFEATALRTGDYRIRVYMLAESASRGERANYRVEVVNAPVAVRPPPAGNPGDNFHASGQLPCTRTSANPSGQCEYGVVRHGSGNAEVTVFRHDGSRRVVYFRNGRATGYNQNQANLGEFRASRLSDRYVVHIGRERYEIPVALVYGP